MELADSRPVEPEKHAPRCGPLQPPDTSMSPMALAALAWAGTGHALITSSRPAVGYARQHGARAWLLMQEGSEAASDKLSFTEKLVKGAQAAGEKLTPGDELSFTEKLETAMKESGANPAYWNRQFITASHIANNVPKGSIVLELGKVRVS